MIVVDTTVLVYAVGGEHRLAEPCRRFVAAVGDGEVQASTTVGVLQEFAHVRARRDVAGGRAQAVGLTRRFATLLAPLLVPTAGDLDRGLDLFERHPEIGAFDAVLAAVTPPDGRLASADRAFRGVAGLEVLDPAEADFVERARRAR